jgi:hypothetical protein
MVVRFGEVAHTHLQIGFRQTCVAQSTSAFSGRWNKIERMRSWYLIEPKHVTYRATIVEWAANGRIPTIYPFRDFVEVGGLMAGDRPSGHLSLPRQPHR